MLITLYLRKDAGICCLLRQADDVDRENIVGAIKGLGICLSRRILKYPLDGHRIFNRSIDRVDNRRRKIN